MFVSLSQQTEKMGERMNSAMNHRRGGGLRKMIRRDPLIRKGIIYHIHNLGEEMLAVSFFSTIFASTIQYCL